VRHLAVDDAESGQVDQRTASELVVGGFQLSVTEPLALCITAIEKAPRLALDVPSLTEIVMPL